MGVGKQISSAIKSCWEFLRDNFPFLRRYLSVCQLGRLVLLSFFILNAPIAYGNVPQKAIGASVGAGDALCSKDTLKYESKDQATKCPLRAQSFEFYAGMQKANSWGLALSAKALSLSSQSDFGVGGGFGLRLSYEYERLYLWNSVHLGSFKEVMEIEKDETPDQYQKERRYGLMIMGTLGVAFSLYHSESFRLRLLSLMQPVYLAKDLDQAGEAKYRLFLTRQTGLELSYLFPRKPSAFYEFSYFVGQMISSIYDIAR